MRTADLAATATLVFALAALVCGALAWLGTRVLPSHEAVFAVFGMAMAAALTAVVAARVALVGGTQAKARAWLGGVLGGLVLLVTALILAVFLLALRAVPH